MTAVIQHGKRLRRTVAAHGHSNRSRLPGAVVQREMPKRTPIAKLGTVRPIIRQRDLVAGPPYFVMGRRASDLEARVYRTLKRLGWGDDDIQFQVDVLGGRLPGGQVLDFVVWTPGGPVVIAVNGDYWHGRSLNVREKDRRNEAVLAAIWGRKYKFLAVYSADLLTDEIAYQRLRREVGRA